MKKIYTLLLAIAVLCFGYNTIQAQVNYTAHDFIIPYEGVYHPGINLGYYGPTWDDNTLGDLAAGNETSQTKGIGMKALRGSLPEGLGRTFTYDIWIDKYDYNDAIGTTDNTLFLGFASAEHRDTVDYCPSNDFDTDMFANLYEPIWDNGENGTPVNDENYYALYVYEVVSRLHESVKFWEIWNEPGFDFTFSTGFLEPGQPGNWWENNPDPCDYKLRAPIFHYIRTLRISYEVIKSIAPDDYVCVAGLGFDSFLDALLRNTDNPDDGKVTAEYPLGAGAYFDVIGFHVYPHIDGTTRFWDPSINNFVFTRHSDAAADALAVRQADRQKVLDAYGYDGVTYPRKEWFATEVNVPSAPLTQTWGSEEVQRNYCMKVNMKAMELDFTQIHLFVLGDFKDEDQAGSEFDLMGSYENLFGIGPGQEVVKESGIGLKTMSDALFGARYDAGQTAAMNLPANVGGGAYRFDDGTYIYALWAKTQNDLSENAFANYSFPAPLNLTAMIRKNWDFSQTGDRISQTAGNISLTSAPAFFRRLQDDPDVFLDVSCNMDIEIQVTSTTPEGGKKVSWPEPTATTNCPGGVTIEQTQGIPNGGFFPFGAFEMQYTITNACGQVKLCAFNVKVASTGGGLGDCNLFRWEMGFVGQFEGNKYFVSKVKKDFAGAQAQAASHGGYLVSIDSPEENEFLRQQVNDLAMIGYNDVAQEGNLEWTSGKEVVFTNVSDCQGCQNSEFGDVVMFNHFNGEWYFVGQDAVEYFIMELPCAEVDGCVCTTEYAPVCGPDGTVYSNSCNAECAGVFIYNNCQECDLDEQDWLPELIESYDCNNLDLTISTFTEGFDYVLVDDGSSVTVDGGYVVYSCEGNIFCTEAGFGSPLCTDLFTPGFLDNLELIYSAEEECEEDCICTTEVDPVCGPDGTVYSNSCLAECEGVFDYGNCVEACDISQLEWLQDTLANTDFCAIGCVTSIESFVFNDTTYIAFYGHEGPCPDFSTEIFSCDGTVFCTEGSIAGLTECTSYFGFPLPPALEILWSADDCADPCTLDGQVWLNELIDNADCSNLDLTISTFTDGGNEYVLVDDGSSVAVDGGYVVYDCEGNIFCTEAGFGSPLCTDLLESDFLDGLALIWSAEEECAMPCNLDEQMWLTDTLNSDALCNNSCLAFVMAIEDDGVTYIAFANDDDVCGAGVTNIYTCEGDLFCQEGSIAELTECSDFFGADYLDDGAILWTPDQCPEPCSLAGQPWLADKLENLDCNGCVASVETFIFNNESYVVEVRDEDACDPDGYSIIDCEGFVVCIEGGVNGNTDCSTSFGSLDNINTEILWSKEEDCEPACEITAQDWFIERLETLTCHSCTQLFGTFEYDGDSFALIIEEDCNGNQATVFDCEGELVCINGGENNSTDCEEMFEDFEEDDVEIIWEKEEDCEDCEYENADWLNLLLEDPATCDNCFGSITLYTWGNLDYVVVADDPSICTDNATNVYTCDGSILCTDGSIAGLNECETFFAQSTFQDTLWSRGVDCLSNSTNVLHLEKLSLYPNPTNAQINLSFEAVEARDLQISIMDVTGKGISQSAFSSVAGPNNIRLETKGLAEGMYFIQVLDSDDASASLLKFVKTL